MNIEQIYTSCLAQASYYIESNGEAAIIDPIRETEPYTQKANDNGTQIKYVFETHFHADFVSGHIDLANKTNSQIIYGPGAKTEYTVYNAEHEEEFSLGSITIKALHTPGHTPESTCYLLIDENGKEHAIFTGDTLFVGDVGRPDLLDGKMTKEELAGMMYDSLNNIIKILPDDVILYPGHGPGSSCGKNLGSETFCTIGKQKQSNYALQDMSKSKFIEILTEGLLPPPQYFFDDARINKNGYENIDNVLSNNLNSLNIEEFEKEISKGALILDTRHQNEFEKGFIPGSINIGIDGMYAIWTGTLIKIDTPLLIVAEIGRENEAISRLARVGYENVVGYLDGGFNEWADTSKKVDTVISITPDEFESRSNEEGKVLDVRKPGEFNESHVESAIHLELSHLESNIANLDPSSKYYVYCRSGYRSMVAASILKANNVNNIVNIYDGINGIKETKEELVS